MRRLYLSPPYLTGDEQRFVADAFASNWIAPLGPHVDAFEQEIAKVTGVGHAAALSSGTAALHLSLRLLDVGPGDDVLCATLTFIGSANPILYQGARPVFVDVDESWTLDPNLVEAELARAARAGKLPKAVIAVDLYGQPANYSVLEPLCARYGVPIVDDAAEALGAVCAGRPAGSFGRMAVLSFNGNKVVTASSGGMLLSNDEGLITRAKFLAAQARDPVSHYEHGTIGYNYRLSNVLAALGRGQLLTLDDRVRARRRNFEFYRRALGDVPGLSFMPEAAWARSNRWLTCLVIDRRAFGAGPADIVRELERQDIEARHVWKPMHLQPVFRGATVLGGEVSEKIFERGVCLPSGSDLTDEDLNRVVAAVRGAHRD